VANQFTFGSFQLDDHERRLTQDGQAIHLQPRTFDVLRYLLEHASKLVSKQEVLDAVWKETIVTESSLTGCIRQIRAALGDDADSPTYIETVPVTGYRFIAAVALQDNATTSPSLRQSSQSSLPGTLISVGLLVLVLGLVYFAYREFVLDLPQQVEQTAADSKPEAMMQTAKPEMSIAVLPFVNMSDDPGNDYFSDGMSEEILHLLATIPNLKVIGRTSSFSFKGKNLDLRSIGTALGVKTILEGSVRKSGERIRITTQLIDVSNGAHIWSESYNRTLSDIFAVQDSVAAAIIDALQIHVGTPPSRGRPTESPAAYALFLKSRAAVNVFEWREAESLLLQATELDSNFAEAYELLAYVYWGLTPWAIEAAEGQKLTSEAAAKAIAIDSELVLANALHQATIFGPNIRSRKLVAFESAAHKQPDNPWLLDLLVFSLAENGYLAESLRMAERYVELDPLSLTANSLMPLALYAVGRTEDAIAAMEVVNRSNTSPNSMTWAIDGINLVEHRDATAIAQFESHVRRNGSDSSWIREMVIEARDPVSGQAHLDRHMPQFLSLMSEVDVVGMYLFFSFLDRHFELIFASEPSPSTWHSAGLHLWRGNIFHRTGFTAHPRYVELARSLGIVESWEQRGPPDFCEKVNGQWVCE
jgi:TolB-like protein/DNA-binding winged helix-turn-helix (wHTH) protein